MSQPGNPGNKSTSACGGVGYVPNPPRLWSRANGNNCPNCASNYGYQNCSLNPNPGRVYSTYELDQRRKAEILKYKNNSSNMSKAQQYSMASRNALTRKKSWATQTQTYTNPNVDNLPEIKIPINSVFQTVSLRCNNANNKCGRTSDCDVPGPVIPLCIDASVPLYNYKPQTTYSSGSNFESFNPFEEPQSMQLPAVIPTPPNPNPNPNPTPPTVVRTVISSTSGLSSPSGNMFHSWDGTTWYLSFLEEEVVTYSFHTVAYNVFANVWIAGVGYNTADNWGEPIEIVNIFRSNDGTSWNSSNVPSVSPPGYSFISHGHCSALACNGARWVAGCNIYNSNNCVFYYSDDNGYNWNTCTLNDANYFPNCFSVACNTVSRMWMSVLSNSSYTPAVTATVTLISTDGGINWNKLSSSSGVNVDLFQTVVCYGTTWIACSVDANSDVSFHRSTDDGTSWTSSSPTFGKGQTVAYNFACNGANTWVGCSGGTNASLIYSNDDGATWQPSANGNTIFNPPYGDVCNSVAWDDTNGKWVAVGSGISVVAYSTNGIHWTAYNPYDVTSEVGTGVAVRPAIVPPLPTPNILTVSGSGYSVIYLDSNGVPGNFHGPQYKDGISGYTVYVFGGSGSFNGTAVPNSTFNVSYLIVGGGGGGGYGANTSTGNYYIGGGGGGAGGLLTNYGSGPTMTLKLNTSYNLTVGLGGAASTNGQNSTFGQLIAVGGGGGGNNGSDGASGGSGGGGGSTNAFNTAKTPGNGTSGQGYAGGTGDNGILQYSSGGGGGGAGAVGQTSSDLYGGNGGIGVSSQITGTPTYYAGGGGAGSATDVVSQGGQGGGGNGSNNSVSSSGGFSAGGLPGMTGTGGGGGGGANNGGMGGSGIIIIRFRSYF
jgi:hypothetical protein